MRYWNHLRTTTEGPFTIVVDKSWEDIPLSDLYDESCYDIEDLNRKINDGTYDWFMLRARVLFNGAEVGEHTMGGFLYEDVNEVFEDGMADDIIWGAKAEARKWLEDLKKVDITSLEV